MTTEPSFSLSPSTSIPAASITFLGHAGFDVRCGDVRLVIDPWLGGSVFDSGWELLLAPPTFDPTGITHLWFSHEHPDHFNPPTLRRIPPEDRPRITAIIARSADARVAEFLRGQGYRVVEVDDGVALPLFSPTSADPVGRITTHAVSTGDSCHLLEIGGVRVLNTNDCAFDAQYPFPTVMRRLGLEVGEVGEVGESIDLLLSQFSYAAWVGNPADVEQRREMAAHKVAALVEQIQLVRPRHVFPCASFVRFAHSENAYLNDESNDFGHVCETVALNGSVPIAMRPGDSFALSEEGFAAAAAHVPFYAAELAAAVGEVRRGERPLVTSEPVSLEDLQSAAEAAMGRVRAGMTRADRFLVGLQQKRAVFELIDHDYSLVIERCRRAKLATKRSVRGDIRLSSSALAYALRNDFGFETLLINGRFTTVHPDGLVVLLKLTGQFGYLRRNERVAHSVFARRLASLKEATRAGSVRTFGRWAHPL